MMKKNMKNFLSILLVCAMSVLLLIGCGSKENQTSLTADIDTENFEKDDAKTVEPDVAEVLSDDDKESVETEITYIEQNDVYLLSNACNDGIQIDLSSFGFDSKQYTLMKSVDIYYTDETLAGYTKENASVYVISSNDEWSFCSFDTDGFLIKKNELMDAILVGDEKADNLVEQPEEQEPIHFDATVKFDKKANVPNEAATEKSTVVESTKMTPDELFAIYRSRLEANGMIWDPSIKDTVSWGTGIISYDGIDEQIQNDLAGFTYGNGDGRPKTHYYMEMTGSDENYIYITCWTY